MELKYKIQQALNKTTDRKSFIQELLVNTLNWPIPSFLTDLDDMSYEWSEEDLNAAGLTGKSLSGPVLQMQKIVDNQPWGIFILEFKNPDIFTTGRGLTTPLRKVLRGLIPKRQRSSKLPAWDRENLLFICTCDYKYYRFAYFKPPKDKGIAPLITFGWESGDAPRTVCEFNLGHLEWPTDSEDSEKWTSEWSKAFDVEKVTKQFYEDYAEIFENVEKLIHRQTNLKNNELRMFTQTLLNRLMFLRFVERKGWLKLDGNPHNYLQRLYQTCSGISQSWYQSRLKVLFFEGLAVPNHGRNEVIGDVPYLNGGLFETTDLDNEVTDIPNEAFEPILGREGLFYRYNFTVEESTPLDIEVAVDPEMLGKVFEELVTGRHETGSYYTPRPIVSFMCKEALKGYLQSKTSASKKAIYRLVDEHEIADDLTNRHAEEILFYLEILKAVDPACGSGAYLLGLLQELIEIRKALQNQQIKTDPEFTYKLKLRLISHCLYGVDIDPFATNIAKLRLWLSLAVESKEPEPLPNLDFKIETGNSVLGPCDPFAQRDDALLMSAIRDRAQKLVLKKDKYMLAHGQEKTRLYNEIKAEEAAIAKETSTVVGEGIIAWHVHFAEVFVAAKRKQTIEKGVAILKDYRVTEIEPGGFDVVIANPPYLGEKGHKEMFREIKKGSLGIFYLRKMDLFYFFFHLALNIGKQKSNIAFITTNYYPTAMGAKKLRQDFKKRAVINNLINFNELKIFKSALGQHNMITILEKSKNENAIAQTCITQRQGIATPEILQQILNFDDVETRYYETTQKELYDGDEHYIRLACSSTISDNPIQCILDKMKSEGEMLNDICYVNQGLRTGADKVTKKHIREYHLTDVGSNEGIFILSREETLNLRLNVFEKKKIKPLFKNSDIAKYHCKVDSDFFLVDLFWPNDRDTDLDKIPNIMTHLHKYKQILQNRKENANGIDKAIAKGIWWFASVRRRLNFEIEKIISPQRSKMNIFAYNSIPWYASADVYFTTQRDKSVSLKYVLALLNSKLYYLWLYHRGKRKGETLELYQKPLSEIPVKKVALAQQKLFVALVDKILAAKKSNPETDTKHLESQIDQMVYALYGLTADDIAVVEKSEGS